eukprot:COSAG02_NODE_15209_length_1193_cov_9.804388_1_plen_65_part_10
MRPKPVMMAAMMAEGMDSPDPGDEDGRSRRAAPCSIATQQRRRRRRPRWIVLLGMFVCSLSGVAA